MQEDNSEMKGPETLTYTSIYAFRNCETNLKWKNRMHKSSSLQSHFYLMSAFQPSVHSHLFLRCLVTKMQCCGIPINGKMAATKIEFSITALDPTATAEPVPGAPRTLRTILLNCLQDKWELIPKTVITVKTKQLVKLQDSSYPLVWELNLQPHKYECV
jgi:hypothetical protein